MSSRKKGKKTKGQTLNLTEFLAGSVSTGQIKPMTWAEEVEDEHEMGYMPSRVSKEPVVLPTAPRAVLGPGVDEENIPTNPPYVAYLSNLPYDIIEEDLVEFFQDMKVSNMRLPKDSNKGKGYGYVEFTDRQSLIDALSMSNIMIKNRRVRIEVSNSSMGRENRRDNYDDSERTTGDWRSRPRDEPSGGEDRFRSRGYENRDRRDDREAGESDKPGNWRDGNRAPAFSDRRGYRGDDDRRGFRGDDERSASAAGDRRGYRDEGPRRGYRDDHDREYSRDRNTGGTWRSEGPPRSAEPPPSSEPRTRPKLKLQPRSKPIESGMAHPAPNEAGSQEEITEEKKQEPESTPTPAQPPVPAANIFGAAKPVDTAAREREIEERLAKTSVEKPKEDGEPKAAWTRRNGEGRGDRDRERPRPTWRSDEDRGRPVDRRQDRQDYRRPTSGRSDEHGDSRGDSRDPPASRSGGGSYRNDNSSNDSRRPLPIRSKYRDDGPPMARGGEQASRSTPDRVRRSKDREDDAPPMPKATDQQAPNFIASNKYSMLHEDADTDNIDD